MNSAHFICRSAAGINKSDGNNEYTCGSWLLTPADASSLVGGRIYMHEAKSERSYFGGTVKSWYPSRREGTTHEEGVTFLIVSDKDAKGVEWRGQDHTMAWFSGVLSD